MSIINQIKDNGENSMYFGGFARGKENHVEDYFEEYKGLSNTLSKQIVLEYMKSLDAGLSSLWTQEIFTGDDMRCGIIIDGDFVYPLEFIHYYENYDIGIPYEYEEYLKGILK